MGLNYALRLKVYARCWRVRDEVVRQSMESNFFFPDSYIIAEIETDNKNPRYVYGVQ